MIPFGDDVKHFALRYEVLLYLLGIDSRKTRLTKRVNIIVKRYCIRVMIVENQISMFSGIMLLGGGENVGKKHANIKANAPRLCKVMLSLLKLSFKAATSTKLRSFKAVYDTSAYRFSQ